MCLGGILSYLSYLSLRFTWLEEMFDSSTSLSENIINLAQDVAVCADRQLVKCCTCTGSFDVDVAKKFDDSDWYSCTIPSLEAVEDPSDQ